MILLASSGAFNLEMRLWQNLYVRLMFSGPKSLKKGSYLSNNKQQQPDNMHCVSALACAQARRHRDSRASIRMRRGGEHDRRSASPHRSVSSMVKKCVLAVSAGRRVSAQRYRRSARGRGREPARRQGKRAVSQPARGCIGPRSASWRALHLRADVNAALGLTFDDLCGCARIGVFRLHDGGRWAVLLHVAGCRRVSGPMRRMCWLALRGGGSQCGRSVQTPQRAASSDSSRMYVGGSGGARFQKRCRRCGVRACRCG